MPLSRPCEHSWILQGRVCGPEPPLRIQRPSYPLLQHILLAGGSLWWCRTTGCCHREREVLAARATCRKASGGCRPHRPPKSSGPTRMGADPSHSHWLCSQRVWLGLSKRCVLVGFGAPQPLVSLLYGLWLSQTRPPPSCEPLSQASSRLARREAPAK